MVWTGDCIDAFAMAWHGMVWRFPTFDHIIFLILKSYWLVVEAIHALNRLFLLGLECRLGWQLDGFYTFDNVW